MAQLCHHHDEFKRLNTVVIVISFGTPGPARAWLEETCPLFTMLLDPAREVYRAYGLKTSWLRTWNPVAGWDYLRLLFSGQRVRGIEADPHQLGGDFIVDSKGILRLVYRSRVATDYPPVADLLALLNEISEKDRSSRQSSP